ncbi:hypothetical protein [Mycobacterium talmoniae]|uniref:ESX-1 secretion-associated protein EspD n=1 Tax=Mycobacterium talmoniae TaxID=1858794 RepID=A0A1S1MPY9_9MYCO|nr:hypothetical protein [Mycobacterium talmoniae]OHU90511.1 hypothetical protein BKN37_25560 [Mycobacterium talmoniae]
MQPGHDLPPQHPSVTVSDPARTITATTVNGYTTNIKLTPAALNGTEADLAAKILAVAQFSRDRDRADRADRLVAESVAAGDNEHACRTYLHKEHNLPTHADVDAAYTAHYQQPNP